MPEVDDANLPSLVPHLVVQVIARSRVGQTADVTEQPASGSGPNLRNLLDRSNRRIDLPREQLLCTGADVPSGAQELDPAETLGSAEIDLVGREE